jgi:hypothetical protein
MQTMPESPSPFSYAQLPPVDAELVRGKAEEIRRSTGRMLDAVLATGQALIAVKQALPHGQFGPWLSAEFSWSERTAQRVMSVAEAFGANPTALSDLTLETVYALAAPANESARRELVDRIERGERPSETEARTIIDASRQMRRLEKEQAAKERERRKEDAAWERQRRSQLTPQAKRNVTRTRKRVAAVAMREQEALETSRQTAQKATELLLSLLPETGLHQLVSLFNKAGRLPGHFEPTFFGALKNRLRDLGWNGKEARLMAIDGSHVSHETVRTPCVVVYREPTDEQHGENVVRPRFR